MMPEAHAAAIIVTHNRAELLRRSIRSVLAQQPGAPPLIVVDNASTDHTPEVLREECPHATVIRLDRNIGCVPARNIAATAARNEILFFLDDDSELAPEAVASATQTLLASDRIGALTGSIVEDGTPTAASTRRFTNLCIGQGVIRRSAFLKVGLYPPDFIYGAEEMDLSLRLLDEGYDIVFDPRVVLFHAADQRTRRPWLNVEVERNMLRVVLMRAPLSLLVPWALKKLCDTLVAAFRTRQGRVIVAEVLMMPTTVVRSLQRRRALRWEAFAVWRYLATRLVNSPDYRQAAARAYPTQWELLLGFLRGIPRSPGPRT